MSKKKFTLGDYFKELDSSVGCNITWAVITLSFLVPGFFSGRTVVIFNIFRFFNFSFYCLQVFKYQQGVIIGLFIIGSVLLDGFGLSKI